MWSIREQSELRPKECDVYINEKLLYFFYGRPSYRPHANKKTLDAKSYLPVCMVMTRDIMKDAVRIMPFDSGAFNLKMMHPPMHDDMKKEEFELVASSEAPMRLVKMFYENERKYFEVLAKGSLEFFYDEYSDLEIDSYFRLLHYRSNNDETDDRVTAIEIQLDKVIGLSGQVHAVILPQPHLDREGVVQQIESWGAKAIPYVSKEKFVPREIQGAVFQRLSEYFEQNGFFGA